MDAIVKWLTDARWDREHDLATKGYPDRPVFSTPVKRGVIKVVVGPLWTTHYHLHKDAISDIDSTKTNDESGVRSAVNELYKECL